MKKVFFAAAIALLLMASSSWAKVGFVDLSKALELTNQGKSIENKLQARKNEAELKLKEREVEIQKLQVEIDKGQGALSAQALEQKKSKLSQLRREYGQMAQEETLNFERYKFELLTGFIGELQKAAEQVAKTKGMELVLLKVEDVLTQASFVLYGDPTADVTNDVIKILNQSTQKPPAPKK